MCGKGDGLCRDTQMTAAAKKVQPGIWKVRMSVSAWAVGTG
jgi:hypothetical protein